MNRLAASVVAILLGASLASAGEAGRDAERGARYAVDGADYARHEHRSADYADAGHDRHDDRHDDDRHDGRDGYGYGYGYGGPYYGYRLGLPYFSPRAYLGLGGLYGRYGYVGDGHRGDRRGLRAHPEGNDHRARDGRDFDRRRGGRDHGYRYERGSSDRN